jgi:hypothetical protein
LSHSACAAVCQRPLDQVPATSRRLWSVEELDEDSGRVARVQIIRSPPSPFPLRAHNSLGHWPGRLMCEGELSPLMLENLTDCLRHAEECARKAAEASRPNARENFLEMQRRWLRLTSRAFCQNRVMTDVLILRTVTA